MADIPVTDDKGNVIGKVVNHKQLPDGSMEVTIEVAEDSRADLFRGWLFSPGLVVSSGGPRSDHGGGLTEPEVYRPDGIRSLTYRVPVSDLGPRVSMNPTQITGIVPTGRIPEERIASLPTVQKSDLMYLRITEQDPEEFRREREVRPEQHVKKIDANGVAICVTCTQIEARAVGGTPVAMYWGEGDCPGDGS